MCLFVLLNAINKKSIKNMQISNIKIKSSKATENSEVASHIKKETSTKRDSRFFFKLSSQCFPQPPFKKNKTKK